jgi:hypothetical protein
MILTVKRIEDLIDGETDGYHSTTLTRMTDRELGAEGAFWRTAFCINDNAHTIGSGFPLSARRHI